MPTAASEKANALAQSRSLLDELISSVLKRMNLDEKAFRSFVAANDGLLRTVASRRRY